MYNLTTYSLEPEPVTTIVIEQSKENLGTIGVFVSSLLLSLGGCIAVMFSSMRQSRCKNIKCCGLSCIRENLQSPDVNV